MISGLLSSVLGLPLMGKLALVALLGVGGLQARSWWTVRGLRSDLAAVTRQLERERTLTADLKVALSDTQANRALLEGVIRDQNRAIAALQATARQRSAESATRAVAELRAGDQRAAELVSPRTTVAPGHEAMNRWLHARVGR